MLRGAQALFGIVVLGLSVTLIRGHHWGDLPASLGFGTFIGGLSFVAALAGVAGIWFEFLGGMVGLVIDSVVALVNLAGGVVCNSPFSSQPSVGRYTRNMTDYPIAVCHQAQGRQVRWESPRYGKRGEAAQKRMVQWRLQKVQRQVVLLEWIQPHCQAISGYVCGPLQGGSGRHCLYVSDSCCRHCLRAAGVAEDEEGLLSGTAKGKIFTVLI